MRELLPREYVPRGLRLDKGKGGGVVYAVGLAAEGENSYGMIAGPRPTLAMMLEFIPEDDYGGRVPCLFRFEGDGQGDLLYEWKGDRWVRVHK